jgi:hypothetical protein
VSVSARVLFADTTLRKVESRSTLEVTMVSVLALSPNGFSIHPAETAMKPRTTMAII